MGIVQTDLILYSALRLGLADLRRNRFVLKDSYDQVISDPFLKDQWGEAEAERLVKMLDKNIEIYMAHKQSINSAKFPCFVIKMGSAQEDSNRESLGDYLETEKVDGASLGGAFPDARIVIENITPISYDNLTGQMTFGNNVNLDTLQVFDGHFVLDTKNNKKYEIEVVIGNHDLILKEPSKDVDLTNMKIVTGDINMANDKKTIWYFENHTIECWSSDSVECVYLWTILMLILQRYKLTLFDARGFNIASYSYGPIEQYQPEDPNVLFYREVPIRGRVAHTVIESTNKLIGAIGVELGICGATSPEGLKEILDNQLWKNCRDFCDPSDGKEE
jgi:hypothetical protein